MTSEPPPPPTRLDDSGPPLGLGGCLKPVTALIAAGVGALLLATGLLVGRCTQAEAPPPASSQTVVTRGPNVVVAVRDLARLEGSSFHMERVIDLKEEQTRLSGLIKAEDAIVLVAAGDVTAGVDLSQLDAADVQIDWERRQASLVLPPAQVFSARLDSERTYVHTRSTDLLAERKEGLETRARQEAERTLKEGALEAGLLARAERNVGRTIESLVRSLGYREVQVTFRRRQAPGQEGRPGP